MVGGRIVVVFPTVVVDDTDVVAAVVVDELELLTGCTVVVEELELLTGCTVVVEELELLTGGGTYS